MTFQEFLKKARELNAERTQGEWQRYTSSIGDNIETVKEACTICRHVQFDNSKFIAFTANNFTKMLDALEICKSGLLLSCTCGRIDPNDVDCYAHKALAKLDEMFK
jgi:hypothetical protein